MMRILLSLLLALGVAASAAAQTAPPPANAAPVPSANPYSATVPVAGTSDAQRSAAIAAALTQVLQQVSPGFVASPDMLSDASGYVRNFRYSRAPSGSGLQLTVDFDPGAVGRLIAQGGATPAAAGGKTAPTGAAGPGTTAAANGTGILWVGGIDSTHAYASLLAMLRGDTQLHDVVPIGADHDGLLLQVGFSAPLADVLATLETPNGHLGQAGQPHPGADASLRWSP